MSSTAAPAVRRFDPHLAAAVVAGAALLLGQSISWLSEHPSQGALVLVWLSLCVGAIYGVQAAWEAIRELRLDIDILMVVGAALSAFIGHPAEGALLLFMFTLAGALEDRALAKAKDAVTRLNKLMPTSAMVRVNGAWEQRAAENLSPGDEVLIRPGETVPADCVIIKGESELDTSTLTGESLPRAVEPGAEAFAGAVNQSGSLEARVVHAPKDSGLQRILQLVIEAQERKQPMQRMIDRFSTPYTAVVFGVAIVSFVVFRFGLQLDWAAAAYRAITLLIVASPCALVIATPTATLCGLSRAARSGLLIKGGDALERLAAVRTVALDKTGTLTLGKIKVHDEAVFGADAAALRAGIAGVEAHSTHPLAAAITAHLVDGGVAPPDVSDLRNIPGRGLEAVYAGAPVRVGKPEWALEIVPAGVREQAMRRAAEARAAGDLAAVGATGGPNASAAVYALADTPRPGADRVVHRLRDAGIDRVAMLTGDHAQVARRVADELGIEVVHADLLPEGKVERLKELKAMPGAGALAIVGDGVNDAPALAVADVGLAMGSVGAGAALEAADVVVLNDDLAGIPWAFALARRVRAVMLANILIAVGVIAVLASLSLFGIVPLGLGVVGHEGSTLVVVAIGLTILGFHGPREA